MLVLHVFFFRQQRLHARDPPPTATSSTNSRWTLPANRRQDNDSDDDLALLATQEQIDPESDSDSEDSNMPRQHATGESAQPSNAASPPYELSLSLPRMLPPSPPGPSIW
jgi:hypothetical protein